METKEKKEYPSQQNTKTISTRVPLQNYVDLLQESMNKGISLSDLLLMKIYDNPFTKKLGSIKEEDNEEEDDDSKMQGFISVREDSTFPFIVNTQNGDFEFQDIDDVEVCVNTLIGQRDKLYSDLMKEKEKDGIDLDNTLWRIRVKQRIIDRIDTLEWDTTSDKIAVRKDFRSLWKDIFD